MNLFIEIYIFINNIFDISKFSIQYLLMYTFIFQKKIIN